jgi:hypothetical protein
VRRLLIASLIVAALVLALGLGLAGCGTAPQSASASGDQTPAGILAAAMDSSSNITSANANFDLSVSFDVDKTKLPAEESAFMTQPIKVSGQLAFAGKPQALDLAVDASLAGQALNAGLKMVDSKAYLSLGGKWYETPAQMTQMLGTSSSQTASADELKKTLGDLGIEPATWMKEVTLVGEETLDGVAVYHLEAAPDLTAIVNDVFKLMQSKQFSGLMGQASAAAGTGSTTETIPSLQSLGSLQTQLPEMFRNLKASVWVAKNSMNVVKATVEAQIVPPAGQDSGGVNAINLSLTLAMKDINKPVSVTAPAPVESWDAFQKALAADPSLLGPLGALGGAALGSTSLGGAGLDTTSTSTSTSTN